jgi:hypothetical protein
MKGVPAMKSKYVAAVALFLVAGGATARCLPEPGSIICQDSQGEYHVIPYSEDSINKTYEPPKSESASSSYETSSHSSTQGASGGRLDTANTEYDLKEARNK